MDDLLPNLVIVFEAFKYLQNLKAEFKSVAPLRFAEAAKQREKNSSYCIHPVIALWS